MVTHRHQSTSCWAPPPEILLTPDRQQDLSNLCPMSVFLEATLRWWYPDTFGALWNLTLWGSHSTPNTHYSFLGNLSSELQCPASVKRQRERQRDERQADRQTDRQIDREYFSCSHCTFSVFLMRPLHTLARFYWKDPDVAVSCIGYFLYLHFKCYPLSRFPSLPETSYHILPSPAMRVFYEGLPPPTHSHLPTHDSPTLGHLWIFIGPRTSPSIGTWHSHPLLHMQLEPCVLLCWWLSPWEFGGRGRGWVCWYCCSSYGFANPFNYFSPFSNFSIKDTALSWLLTSTSVFVRLWQGLSGDKHIRLLSAYTSWHPQECLGLVTVYRMNPQVGESLGCFSFSLCSTLYLHVCSYEYIVLLLRRTSVATL
jgi:hypothetical protein